MNDMVLGELASKYRLLKPSGHGYERAKSRINEETLMGPPTDELVAGTSNVVAPETMMLKNGKILKRRQDVDAVPILLFSGCLLRVRWGTSCPQQIRLFDQGEIRFGYRRIQGEATHNFGFEAKFRQERW